MCFITCLGRRCQAESPFSVVFGENQLCSGGQEWGWLPPHRGAGLPATCAGLEKKSFKCISGAASKTVAWSFVSKDKLSSLLVKEHLLTFTFHKTLSCSFFNHERMKLDLELLSLRYHLSLQLCLDVSFNTFCLSK